MAVWALYYLSNKKKFSCKEDSQFIMINKKKFTTDHNFYYPYDLFCYYSLNIHRLIKNEVKGFNINIPVEYRYIN